MSSWENTRKIYVEWLQKNKLRNVFSKKIKIENLSLWWLTDLVNKDNINEQKLFEDLSGSLWLWIEPASVESTINLLLL